MMLLVLYIMLTRPRTLRLLTRVREDQRGRHIIADIRYPIKTDSGGDGSEQACLLHTESDIALK